MLFIEIAFDFSTYDLLMLQIQQITIFSSLQPINSFEILFLCISSFFFFWKKKKQFVIGTFVQ